jgi:hypothetical protein
MCAVEFLEALLAGRVHVGAVDGHHVVAAVGGWVEDRLVLAHEDDGDGGGNAPKGPGVRANVDEMPCARVGEAGLYRSQKEGCLGAISKCGGPMGCVPCL